MTSSPAIPQNLPAAPANVVDEAGQPRMGRYAGQTGAIDWTALAAPYARSGLWRRFHHKRWQYVALSTPQLLCGIAIVDVGWTNTAFAYVFDRIQGKQIAGFSQDGIPGLSAQVSNQPGGASRFSCGGNRIVYQPPAGAPGNKGKYQLSLHSRQFSIEAEFDDNDAAPQLLAVGPIVNGSVHATQKSPGMPLSGEVLVDGQRFDLQDGVASFDYSNGLLARNTEWRWASAHGLDIGFNLQAGYFGKQENVLWLDGQLHALGHVRFEYDLAAPLAPWHIYTDDGLLDLQFMPEGARRENKNLLIAATRYIQPVGSFSGWVKPARDATPRPVEHLVGVTEEHFSRW
ncbi:hypothetical protein LT85_4809 [Collimonas arenae]|uniref:DUF2804 domain-containing protein n=1 Tax=Collimonas arenae TaxID=279058 RepID=A0A0A1FLY4_9BURK|nr:DUF2804 domain-containing protein [Collimonas arenae]AIY43967.1 hypothetical protein LT85_4809 [Collimonas arenae]